MRVNGKDKWHSTGTDDIKEAKRVQKAIIKGIDFGKAIDHSDSATAHEKARKVSKVIAEGLSGRKLYKLKLKDSYVKWLSLTPEISDISEGRQKQYRQIFDSFAAWCSKAGLEYIEEITNEIAIKYAGVLWNKKVTENTFNDHCGLLSRVFTKLDAALRLPHRNPFCKEVVPRKRVNKDNTASHKALEPDEVDAVLKEAAKKGQDYLDLFVIGYNTGLRLKDAALLEWDEIDGDFISLTPSKTKKHATEAYLPLSSHIREVLDRRRGNSSQYIIPKIAKKYSPSRSDQCYRKLADIFALA